jgi:hypothetical protein
MAAKFTSLAFAALTAVGALSLATSARAHDSGSNHGFERTTELKTTPNSNDTDRHHDDMRKDDSLRNKNNLLSSFFKGEHLRRDFNELAGLEKEFIKLQAAGLTTPQAIQQVQALEGTINQLVQSILTNGGTLAEVLAVTQRVVNMR